MPCAAKSAEGAESLKQEPKADEDQRGDSRAEPDDEERDERKNLRARKKDDICAEDSRDCTARA